MVNNDKIKQTREEARGNGSRPRLEETKEPAGPEHLKTARETHRESKRAAGGFKEAFGFASDRPPRTPSIAASSRLNRVSVSCQVKSDMEKYLWLSFASFLHKLACRVVVMPMLTSSLPFLLLFF